MKKIMSDTLVPLAYDRYNPETYPSNPRQREAVKNIKVVPQKIKKNSDISKTLFQDIIKKIGKKTIPAPKTSIKLKGGGSTTKETIKVVELPDSSPDYLMEQYIREIFDGTIDSDISFDKWLDEREQFELGLPYTKNIIDEIKEYAAKEQIENETSGIKSLKRIL